MAAASNIVINDGQGTPVAHTFTPARKDGFVVEWEERTTSHAASGFYTLSISQTSPKSSSPVIRTKVNLAVPIEVLDSVTGVYSYPNTARLIVEVLEPVGLTAAQRADIYAYTKNLLAHATLQAAIKDLDAPF